MTTDMADDKVFTFACMSCRKPQPHTYLGRSLSGYKARCNGCGFTITFVDTKNIPDEAVKQKGVERGPDLFEQT